MSGGGIDEKYYVYIGAEGSDVVCLKLTSKTKYYDDRPPYYSGCVEYKTRQIHPDLTASRTLIDTERLWRIPRNGLAAVLAREPERIKGLMPRDFHERLTAAIGRSEVLGEDDRHRRLGIIGSASAPACPSEQSPSASAGPAS
jgi:hypothetical protein